MINNGNIQMYISYLYKRKTGDEIPNDILSSWNGLEDNEISHHLMELYTSWNIGINDAKMMENEFLTKLDKPKPKIPDINALRDISKESDVTTKNPDQTIITHSEVKSKRLKPLYWLIPLGVLLVVITAYISKNYEFYNPFEDTESNASSEQSSYAPPPVTQSSVSPQPQPETPAPKNSYTSEYEPPVKVGTVEVSTKGFLGTKNRDRIIKQLEKKARKLYPGYSRLENTRYEGDNATADVMIDP